MSLQHCPRELLLAQVAAVVAEPADPQNGLRLLQTGVLVRPPALVFVGGSRIARCPCVGVGPPCLRMGRSGVLGRYGRLVHGIGALQSCLAWGGHGAGGLVLWQLLRKEHCLAVEALWQAGPPVLCHGHVECPDLDFICWEDSIWDAAILISAQPHWVVRIRELLGRQRQHRPGVRKLQVLQLPLAVAVVEMDPKGFGPKLLPAEVADVGLWYPLRR
mmetsp:Transcript_100/g.330  ORF Transcript_100/g.330 Transcript_100/m.330 type:complete len:217 (+) Transcript_100:3026-3676(+)